MSGGGAPDLLLGIVEARKVHVADAKKTTSAQDLRDKIAVYEGKHGPAVSIVEKIRQSAPKIAVAAEFKRASPSKGDIAVDADAAEQAMLYAQGGASVISVLTEPARFKGSLDDMLDVALKVETLGRARRPAVLRKDFIFDTYQVLEARAYGADSLLLIVAILTLKELTALLAASRELGMEPLVEVNNEHELDVAIEAGAKLIGVNNRNLRTFKLDLNTTVDIAHAIRRRGIPLEGTFTATLVCFYVLIFSFLNQNQPLQLVYVYTLFGSWSITLFAVPVVGGITDAATALVAAKHGANLIGIIFVSNSPRNVHLDTAVDIVQVVRKFGERSSRVRIELDELEVPPSSSLDSITGWFQSHAKKLSAASARTPLVVGMCLSVRHTRTVMGGGCTEVLMAQAIDELAPGIPGKKSLAMEAFARALRQIPAIIADNGGYDSAELVTQLRAAHFGGHNHAGLNMTNGSIGDMEALGIRESYKSKMQVLLSAAEAAEMILRVDDIVKCAPRQRQG
ncbi:hypothetical protein DYB37_008691 [Aphanomyces astaci]|uniref:indole-3-glycerol-phosphate synthase n=2 Tax=Aphanomyces astaci TaxID=112090 RepID=A0A418ED32_APHAT|nr:hypothetical protein DYB37_008691 [Aphanomyces astaci]